MWGGRERKGAEVKSRGVLGALGVEREAGKDLDHCGGGGLGNSGFGGGARPCSGWANLREPTWGEHGTQGRE